MKRRRAKVSSPPYPGEYVKGPITELVCEEQKAGRPRAPLVDLLSPRAPDDRDQVQAEPAEPPKASPEPE